MLASRDWRQVFKPQYRKCPTLYHNYQTCLLKHSWKNEKSSAVNKKNIWGSIVTGLKCWKAPSVSYCLMDAWFKETLEQKLKKEKKELECKVLNIGHTIYMHHARFLVPTHEILHNISLILSILWYNIPIIVDYDTISDQLILIPIPIFETLLKCILVL